jgi:hypothetical protein
MTNPFKAFINYVNPEKIQPKYRAVYIVGECILLADFGWWLTWVAFAIRSLSHRQLNDSTSFFDALASPHTALIPTMFAILSDLYNNCNTEQCQVTTPAFTWYSFPILMIPYDAISLSYNIQYYGKNHWTYGLSIYTLIVSSLTALWSISCYAAIISARNSRRVETVKDGESPPVAAPRRAAWGGSKKMDKYIYI